MHSPNHSSAHCPPPSTSTQHDTAASTIVQCNDASLAVHSPPPTVRCGRHLDQSRMALLLRAAITKVHPVHPPRQIFPYGNYHSYYGYRQASAFEEDARLKVCTNMVGICTPSHTHPQVLQRCWFEGKDVLDVGCNEGLVTIAIAAKFATKSALGLDLDPHLVRKAKRYAATVSWYHHCGSFFTNTYVFFPPCLLTNALSHSNLVQERAAVQAVIRDRTRPRSIVRAAKRHMAGLLFTSFRHADMVHMPDPPVAAFDCVLALSITKWVHVNWGDDGLLEFFTRLVNALRPGGLLVLEPQPWRSYKAIRHKHNVKWPHVPLAQLALRPEGFVALLQERFGLTVVKEATPCGGVEGFRRPVVVMKK